MIYIWVCKMLNCMPYTWIKKLAISIIRDFFKCLFTTLIYSKSFIIGQLKLSSLRTAVLKTNLDRTIWELSIKKIKRNTMAKFGNWSKTVTNFPFRFPLPHIPYAMDWWKQRFFFWKWLVLSQKTTRTIPKCSVL